MRIKLTKKCTRAQAITALYDTLVRLNVNEIYNFNVYVNDGNDVIEVNPSTVNIPVSEVVKSAPKSFKKKKHASKIQEGVPVKSLIQPDFEIEESTDCPF